MSRRTSNGTKGIVFGIVLLMLAVGAGAYFASRSQQVPPREGEEPRETGNIVRVTEEPRVRIYVLKLTADDAYLAPETVKIKPGVDPKQAALQELLDTNRWEGESKNLIPRNTRLLSLSVKDGVATANFSKELVDNFNGGARFEALTIHSVVHTLTQFQDVNSVRFLVEGQKLETLAGHLDVSEPVEGDSTLLEGGG